MNAALIKPFLVATQRVFEKMLECPCRIGKPAVARGLPGPGGSLRAVIQVSGSHDGYMVLGLPPGVADVAGTLLDVPERADSAARQSEAMGIVARLIKTVLRRGASSQMKFKIVPDSAVTDISLASHVVWLTAPIIGRFGKFSFALSLKPTVVAKPSNPGALVAAVV